MDVGAEAASLVDIGWQGQDLIVQERIGMECHGDKMGIEGRLNFSPV
jgi:hypothetical protein